MVRKFNKDFNTNGFNKERRTLKENELMLSQDAIMNIFTKNKYAIS